MNRVGLTLQEEAFCQLIALGKSGVDAYSEAFGLPALNEKTKRLYTKRASNLANRADVAVRIVEAKGEQKRRDEEMWRKRGDAIAEGLFSQIHRRIGKASLLKKDTLKGIEVLAKLKGLNAPEEKVLKDGGRSDNYTPRGLEGVSDGDLDKIIAQGEVIDAEVLDESRDGVDSGEEEKEDDDD